MKLHVGLTVLFESLIYKMVAWRVYHGLYFICIFVQVTYSYVGPHGHYTLIDAYVHSSLLITYHKFTGNTASILFPNDPAQCVSLHVHMHACTTM